MSLLRQPPAGPSQADADGLHSSNNTSEHGRTAPQPNAEPAAATHLNPAKGRPREPLKSAGWEFLKHPAPEDIRQKRRRVTQQTPYQSLVVMDFEWTCDNKPFPHPPEIIEFPGVLVQGTFPFQAMDEFQVYVRPEKCPRLSGFCTSLTAITQEMVDRGVAIKAAVEQFHSWLASHGLVPRESSPWTMDSAGIDPGRRGSGPGATGGISGTVHSRALGFAIVTWGDVDVMTTLRRQLQSLGLPIPPYYTYWINLKALFRQHYKREPTGGLQKVVERCGLRFEGRAHSGLVDSRNTAKIVQQMLSQGFRFCRPTRCLDSQGNAFGEKRKEDSRGPAAQRRK